MYNLTQSLIRKAYPTICNCLLDELTNLCLIKLLTLDYFPSIVSSSESNSLFGKRYLHDQSAQHLTYGKSPKGLLAILKSFIFSHQS